MANTTLVRFTHSTIPIYVLIGVLSFVLFLLVQAIGDSTRFGELYLLLLTVSILGLVGLGGLCLWNLLRLIGQIRKQASGAQLTGRFVSVFVTLSVIPVLFVYLFAVRFLHEGIDNWFDVRTETALSDALELSRTAINTRMRERFRQIETLAAELDGTPNASALTKLNDLYEISGASELALLTPAGRIITATTDTTTLNPNRPDEAVLLQLRQTGNYINWEPIGDEGWFIRTIVPVPQSESGEEIRFLQALFPVAERTNALAQTVEKAYTQNQELTYLRTPLKVTFIFILSLVLLFSLLSAVWAAFFFARRMVAPLQQMAAMTRSVAQGDYDRQLPAGGPDDVGFLIDSFNIMTRTLDRERAKAHQSQQHAEEQRTYLQAVLTHLSSGVLTIDTQGNVFTVNKMAEHILGINLGAHINNHLQTLETHHPHLAPLLALLTRHFTDTNEDWREELTWFSPNGKKILMCRGTPLPSFSSEKSGHLLVFDDLTTLIEAQRNQAWSEVARRLAHEIKNPLTPIQLSAERLRRKYLGSMDSENAATLDRLTRTIVHQVEGMKEMVNEFSDYARVPEKQTQHIDLNALIQDIAELYAGEHNIVELSLEPDIPLISGNTHRLRQVFHNLFKNALEAKTEHDKPHIHVSSVLKHPHNVVEICLQDDGEGLPEDIRERLFEPYVSSKPKGSGLGLAIAKKIIEEHSGVIWAENRTDAAGARMILRFPEAK